MKLFRRKRDFDMWARVRELGGPDWSRVEGHERFGGEGDDPIGAASGWFVDNPMAPVHYGGDQPCTVFLTKYHVFVDVRPDASILDPILIDFGIYNTERAGTGRSDIRSPRFVGIYATNYGPDGEVKGVTIDFEKKDREFAETLGRYGERFVQQTDFQKSIIADMDAKDETGEAE
jgi:hypothetical protein